MKKLICILCSGLFLGACASASNGDADDLLKYGGKHSLSQIHKRAETIITSLEEKEGKEDLTEEDKEWKQVIKEWQENPRFSPLKKYASRSLTSTDFLFVKLADDEGYSLQEIDKYLQTGFYVKNPYCDNEFKSFRVFQVAPDYVLTLGCKKDYEGGCDVSQVKIFLFLKHADDLYYDEKILTSPNGACPTYVGVFQYTSKDDNLRTVPIMEFFPKTIAKDQLEIIRALRNKTRDDSNVRTILKTMNEK